MNLKSSSRPSTHNLSTSETATRSMAKIRWDAEGLNAYSQAPGVWAPPSPHHDLRVLSLVASCKFVESHGVASFGVPKQVRSYDTVSFVVPAKQIPSRGQRQPRFLSTTSKSRNCLARGIHTMSVFA